VAQLREIAKGIDHEAVKGYSVMHKEHLLVSLCKALNIEMLEHHDVVGINKTEIKARVKALKVRRDQALAAHDHAELKSVRRQIHHLKRRIHKATV
jgi:hypothetical protein